MEIVVHHFKELVHAARWDAQLFVTVRHHLEQQSVLIELASVVDLVLS